MFIRMINSQQTFLPDKEIFLSVGDDGLPIVELLVSPIIEILNKVSDKTFNL